MRQVLMKSNPGLVRGANVFIFTHLVSWMSLLLQYLALESALCVAPASYLAALFLPEDGRWRVSRGAALEGDAPPLGGNLVSGLCSNLRWYWKRRRSVTTH